MLWVGLEELNLRPCGSWDIMLNTQWPWPYVHQEPTSVKKLLKGDGAWAVIKVILGWLLDTVAKTLQLPQHCYEWLHSLFEALWHQRWASIRKWHQLLGELCSMVLAIPGGWGLFSILQTGFKYMDKNRICLDQHIKAQLADFESLAKDLTARPTRLAKIIPDADATIGAVDASKAGMGGIWFTPDERPLLWWVAFPKDVQARLVSTDNPMGTLTNSDLELAGVVAHPDILVQVRDVREATIGVLNDNFTAVSRTKRGSITTWDSGAYLLWIGSLHQWHYCYLSKTDYIPGDMNGMADDASHLWHYRDSQLLSYFNLHYPQNKPWQLCQLRPEMLLVLILALCKQRVEPALFLNEPHPKITRGLSGSTFAWSTAKIHSFRPWVTRSSSFRSLLSAIEMADWQNMDSPSSLGLWRMPSGALARWWPHWGPMTSDLSTIEWWTTDWSHSLMAMPDLTQSQTESSQSQWAWFGTSTYSPNALPTHTHMPLQTWQPSPSFTCADPANMWQLHQEVTAHLFASRTWSYLLELDPLITC